MAPDYSLVAEGYGNPRGYDFVAAARTSNGTTAMIYLPTSRTFTVDLSTITGQEAKAWWFDPERANRRQPASTERGARHRFQPPGRGDWVLGVRQRAAVRPLR